MAGLLDFLDSPDAQLGLGLLAAGGPSMKPMSFGQRLAGAMQGVQAQRAAADERALKKQLIEAQIGNYGSEAEYRRAQAEAQRQEAALRQAALVREAEKRAALPSLFQSPTQQALAGGGGQTQANAVVMDRLPQGQLGPIDIPTALGKGYTPKEIEELQALRNSGMPKVARTVETTDAQGRPVILQLDEFGRPVGQGMAQWKQPVTMSLGNRQAMVDPVSRQELGSFAMGQSPDSIASNAISIRGQNMVDARARDANQAAKVDKPPSGYRWSADGTRLEQIPGGPADNKTMTEGQSKAFLFGSRANEAHNIIGQLAQDGTVRPSIIKQGMESLPLIGGLAGAGANAWFASAPQQQVEQAQRDFVNAVLRRESGAAIAKDEFSNAEKQYFPQIGDGPEVIRQKAKNRELAIRGILSEVPGAQRSGIAPPSGGVQPPQAAINDLKMRKGDPNARAQFDAVFGAGAADAALGGR